MKTLSTLLLIAAVAAGIDANSAEVTRIAAGDHTMLLTKDGKIYVSGKTMPANSATGTTTTAR